MLTKTTPFKLNINDKWNKKKQSVNNNSKLNKKLLELHSYIIDAYNEATSKGINIDKNWIERTHNLFFNPVSKVNLTPKLLDYIIDFKDNYENESTVKKLGALITRVEKYSPTLLINYVDINWISDYSVFLKSMNYAPASINKDLQLIKQILRHADNNDITRLRLTPIAFAVTCELNFFMII